MSKERAFTDEQVLDYRRKYAKRETSQYRITKDTGVSKTTVKRMLNGVSYKHIDEADTEPRKQGFYRTKCTEADDVLICVLHGEGLSIRDISKQFDVSSSTIHRRLKAIKAELNA